MRKFESFRWKEANFRLSSSHNDCIKEEIQHQRHLLEEYINRHPEFKVSLVPLDILPKAPEIVCRMQAASLATGVGPMAAVAGTFSQLAAESVLSSLPEDERSQSDVIVENGGDLYVAVCSPILIGLWAGSSSISENLALSVAPEKTPLAICSSSGTMGHSLSLGKCDLGTVISKDASLADAAATLLCNLIQTENDIQASIEEIITIPGIIGALAVKGNAIGIVGDMPSLVRPNDLALKSKITRAQGIIL